MSSTNGAQTRGKGGAPSGGEGGAPKGGKGGKAKRNAKLASWCRNCRSSNNPCPCALKQSEVAIVAGAPAAAPKVEEPTVAAASAVDWLRSNLSGGDAAAVSSAFGGNGIATVEDMKLVSKDDLVELKLPIGNQPPFVAQRVV